MHKHENNFSRAQTRGEVDLKKKELWGVSVLGDRFSEELLLHSSSLSLNSHLGFGVGQSYSPGPPRNKQIRASKNNE